MRTCLVNRKGHERWMDDDRETPADNITVSNIVDTTEYEFLGEFKTQGQCFRRYKEVVHSAAQ